MGAKKKAFLETFCPRIAQHSDLLVVQPDVNPARHDADCRRDAAPLPHHVGDPARHLQVPVVLGYNLAPRQINKLYITQMPLACK